MTIGGFTFIRNASKLYIPVVQAIKSVLPIVDEFIVVIGEGDHSDNTKQLIESINSPKLKMHHSKWNVDAYPKNTIYAQQTNLAKSFCSADWLVYIQGDEALHEDDLPYLKSCITRANEDSRIEGLTLNYLHFWGDYQHYHITHNWYQKEIRVIKNHPQIWSWGDAQSFRFYQDFQDSFADYKSKLNKRKLNVATTKARVFHYGHVRPPQQMTNKKWSSFSSYHGNKKAKQLLAKVPEYFDYGPLNKLRQFKGTHPKVMDEWIADFHWGSYLQYSGSPNPARPKHKHEQLKYRVLASIEQNLLGGKTLGGIKNYSVVAHY